MEPHLSYEQVDGVHIFTWHNANRRAIDAWLDHMTTIMERDGQLGMLILDFSAITLPPVRYASQRIRAWMMRFPDVPHTVVAVVYASQAVPFLIVARSYASTLGRGRDTSLEFFPDTDAQEVWGWLQSQAAASR